MKSEICVERPKLFLFKFLAHQIHPFAYAVNTFLQPALDDCRILVNQNPHEALNILLSLAQTFTRFAPDSELIYDDIQNFAKKLKETIDRCLTSIDSDFIRQSSKTLESVQQNLNRMVRQPNNPLTSYTDMYKNMSEKLNSLPVELQKVIFDDSLEKTIPIELVPSQESNGRLLNTNSLTKQIRKISIDASTVDSKPSTNDRSGTQNFSQPIKKASPAIAAFPPRNYSNLSAPVTNGQSNEAKVQHASVIGGTNDYETERLTPTNGEHSSVKPDEEWNESESRKYYLHPCFKDPVVAADHWHRVSRDLSSVAEQSFLCHDPSPSQPIHVTDEYFREFKTKTTTARALRGELCKTYGTVQSGPKSSCLPIGIALMYDELTLLSCDVHRDAQNVRLFDIQSGRLKHTIVSDQKMKLHRPSAVMSNVRNQILIVERDFIYMTEDDGRLVQTFGHRSVKQLYGIATFRDRYLLTIDSKPTDDGKMEQTRLLLFDPNTGKLAFEQALMINQEHEEFFKQQSNFNIRGKLLPPETTKPRFLAVNNDQIYIADLGRSLIYGTSIRNQFDFHCKTVFGGQGRAAGEMTDPSGLFIDTAGNVISADSKNDRIQIFSPNGEYRTTVKLNDRIKRPSGICTNRAGTQFYVSCYLAGCVRAFNINY